MPNPSCPCGQTARKGKSGGWWCPTCRIPVTPQRYQRLAVAARRHAHYLAHRESIRAAQALYRLAHRNRLLRAKRIYNRRIYAALRPYILLRRKLDYERQRGAA